ncbi:hypothetical protein D6C78_09011 [Aureobasidium pullulans]|uniref:Uncharacterized protein n=1 Tax=Aureobasidium pullulans TaxID=5580 RepID=A0A4T0BB41_AURPU|nr:hypothetical protein D6C78_09011 [Aureobasidium pullulans]
MGKLPYPQLRNLKHFENGKTVPSYNPKLPWMGYGKILRYFTPEALIQFGIINLSPSFRLSSNFEVDPRAIKAIRSKERFAPDNSGIHPIFKNTPDHWDHTSDLMYEYLKPSLRIASKILDMEVVLDFLTAVGKPWVEEEPTLLHEAKSGQKQYSFYPKPLTSAERAVTAEALIHMQDFVDFDWDFSSPLSVAAYTITRKVWDKSHKRMVWDRGMCDYAGSYSSTIKFNGEWKKFLNLDNLPGNDFVPNTDSTSRLLRTQFTLAFTMVHELVHAWVRNMRRDALRIDEVEPYCNDDRIAEPGWALMSAIFGSIGWPIANNPVMYDAPFGMSTIRFPGTRDLRKTFAAESYKGTPAKWGVDISTEYALPMDFIGQFFTNDFWDTRVERFGSGMLRSPKPLGVREVHEYTENSFEAPESPRVKRRLVDGVEVDDPEARSPEHDTLHPGVRKGILLPDSAFDGVGNRLDLRSGKIQKTKRKKTARQLGILSPIPEAPSPVSPMYPTSLVSRNSPVSSISSEDTSMPDAPDFDQGYVYPPSQAPNFGQGYDALPPALTTGQGNNPLPPSLTIGQGYDPLPPSLAIGQGFNTPPPAPTVGPGYNPLPPALAIGLGPPTLPPFPTMGKLFGAEIKDNGELGLPILYQKAGEGYDYQQQPRRNAPDLNKPLPQIRRLDKIVRSPREIMQGEQDPAYYDSSPEYPEEGADGLTSFEFHRLRDSEYRAPPVTTRPVTYEERRAHKKAASKAARQEGFEKWMKQKQEKADYKVAKKEAKKEAKADHKIATEQVRTKGSLGRAGFRDLFAHKGDPNEEEYKRLLGPDSPEHPYGHRSGYR